MSDPFVSACPVFRNADRLGSAPIPLAAYEVASYRKPLTLGRLAFRVMQFAGLMFVCGAAARFLLGLGSP